MSTRSTTAPAALAVTLAAAKESLRIDDTALDGSITLAIQAITQEAEHQTGRSFVNQGWRLSVDQFSDALRLDYPPIVAVASVRFYDANNVLQTLDPADYLLDSVSEPGFLVPAPGRAWPATFDRVHAVMVDYTAGYGPTADTVPAAVQHYILVRLQESFDPSGREFKDTVQSKYAERLLDRVRVYS